MTIQQLLEITIARGASDLHLAVGFPPILRIHGELLSIPETESVTAPQIETLITPLFKGGQLDLFKQNLELDFSFDFEGKSRFRVNVYRQKGTPAAALRLIPLNIRTIEELNLPKVLEKLADLKQGFILICGPTGHGKSTTLAALINRVNQEKPAHIITIEDPIEYVYPPGKSLVSQRELVSDTLSWSKALRSALREDPDVVLIGEMRDLDTISSAITIAETGHLVFTTLHTNSASQSIDRIIDVFPEYQQTQIRLQLAATLEAVISLRLVPTISPGRLPATEILWSTRAIQNLIREGKTYLIDNVIQTSSELGMMTLEASLATLVKSGKVTREVALNYALRPQFLSKLLG